MRTSEVADYARSRISVFRSARARPAAELGQRVHGSVVRERASIVRAVGRELSQRFHRAQDGSVRPGLTIEDGSLVVTDNYLKVRIPHGLAAERAGERARLAGERALVGTVV